MGFYDPSRQNAQVGSMKLPKVLNLLFATQQKPRCRTPEMSCGSFVLDLGAFAGGNP